MRTLTLDKDRVKSILLNSKYTNGNIPYLMQYAELSYNLARQEITIDVHLDSAHWAFTHQEEPGPRYRLCANREDVFDSFTGETVGYFNTEERAEEYAAFLNDKD